MCGLVAKKSLEIHASNKWGLIINVLQRWPWHRPACWNSSRPDDCKIPMAGMSRGQPQKSMTCQENISLTRHRLLSGGTVRRNSLRCAPFNSPTVSCVLAPARTCLRQAPPTSRGRGLATSAVADCLSGYTSSLSFSSFEVLMEAMMLFMAFFVTIWVSVLKPAEPCR